MLCLAVPGAMGLELLTFCKIVIALITENCIFLKAAGDSLNAKQLLQFF